MHEQEQVSHFLHKQEYIATTGLILGNTDACAVFWNHKCGVLLIIITEIPQLKQLEILKWKQTVLDFFNLSKFKTWNI